MRQRLGLAATLLGDPAVLVLDEPANGLDPQGIRWLRDFLRSMADEGRTVLVSSHVLAEVAQTADDAVVIHAAAGSSSRGYRAADRRWPRGRPTPRPAELRAAPDRAGLTATADGDEPGVDYDDPARVGDIVPRQASCRTS